VKGCRPLAKNEVEAIKSNILSTKHGLRDMAIFCLGIKSGLRISEILSLKVKDVFQNGRVVERVTVAKHSMKGGKASRSVILNEEVRQAILEYLEAFKSSPDSFLFKSQKDFNRPLTRIQAYRILKDAYDKASLTGKLATHTMRKTFANNVHNALGHDIFKTQKALGHSNIRNTVFYLSFKEEEIEQAILSL
jgi:site-specific recombinase XerD